MQNAEKRSSLFIQYMNIKRKLTSISFAEVKKYYKPRNTFSISMQNMMHQSSMLHSVRVDLTGNGSSRLSFSAAGLGGRLQMPRFETIARGFSMSF